MTYPRGSEIETIQLASVDADGFTTCEDVPASRVGPCQYRLAGTPVFVGKLSNDGETPSPRLGDVIEVDEQRGCLRFVRVIQPSTLQTYFWVLNRALVNAPEFAAFCARIVGAGGEWEQVYGAIAWSTFRSTRRSMRRKSSIGWSASSRPGGTEPWRRSPA